MNIVTLVVFNLVKAGSKQTSQYETVLSGANPESKNECVQLEYLKLDPKDLLRVSNITVQLEKFDKRFEFNNSIHIEISASPEKKISSQIYHGAFACIEYHTIDLLAPAVDSKEATVFQCRVQSVHPLLCKMFLFLGSGLEN